MGSRQEVDRTVYSSRIYVSSTGGPIFLKSCLYRNSFLLLVQRFSIVYIHGTVIGRCLGRAELLYRRLVTTTHLNVCLEMNE